MLPTVIREKLQKEYQLKYPNGPQYYTPYLVGNISISEFKGYLGADIDVSNTIERIAKPLHENFTRHLLKHHDKLNWVSKCVYDDHKQKITRESCHSFDEGTNLKYMIVKAIQRFPTFALYSTESSVTPRRDLLMNFCTEIQTILASSILMYLKAVRTENDLEDPWSPIHLSLSFALFCRLMNDDFHHGIIDKEDRYMDTYKQKYILHMSNAATSKEEFVLAILSAYGTDPRQYPSAVLRMMGEKEMLRDNLQACHTNFPSTVGVDTAKSIIPPRTTADITRVTAVTHASNGPTIFHQIGHLSESKSQSPIPPVSSSTTFKNYSWNSSTTVSCLPDASTPTSDSNKTVSLKKFLEGGSECWKLFYGNETTKPIPLTWYSNFVSQFPFPNNKDGLLTSCADILARDKRFGQGQNKIRCLSDTITSTQLDEIKKELSSSIPKFPGVVPTSASGVELLMWHNKSTLQHAIIPPLSLEETQGRKSMSVPRPDAWAPSLCVMPFHGFYAHIEWYLSRKIGKSPQHNIKGLDLEIIKLSYVEYHSVLNKHPNQFILGIFTAYGPHVLTYPVRVLELMKGRDLLRKNTKLFDVIKTDAVGGFGNTYSNITRNLGSLPSPKQNGAAAADRETVVVNGQDKPPASFEFDWIEFGKQHDVKRKLEEKFPISNSFESWTIACNRTMTENSKEGMLNYEIPESFYRELYKLYKEVFQNLQENNSDDEYAFHLFALGVWSGQCLNDFRKDSISTIGIQTEFERQSTGTQTEENQPSASNAELVGSNDRDVVHVPKYSGQLQLSKTALQTLANVGFGPDATVESILTSFVSYKKTEQETIQRIQDNFAGDKIHNFVKESACRMCWVSNEDERKFIADLIKELIEKKLVSKSYVIQNIKDSVIKHLPYLAVKVANVTTNVAEFLVHLFMTEDDFCWFITLTTELSQSFPPIWSGLVSKTVRSLRRRTSETTLQALFSKTPGAREFLCINHA